MNKKEVLDIIDKFKFNNTNEFRQFSIRLQTNYKSEKSIERDKIRAEINPKVRARDNYLCFFCGRNVFEVNGNNTIHHRVPERYGGDTAEHNLITICMFCHQKLEILIGQVERQVIKATFEETKKELKEKIKNG